MGEFWISCTTCHARLKVRDRAAIGQIVACPKCGSMVLVTAPADERSTAASERAAAAPTAGASPSPAEKFGFDDVDALVAGRPDTEASLAPTTAAAPPGAANRPPTGSAVVPTSATPEELAALGAFTSTSTEVQPDLATPPKPWRSWVILAGAASCGVLLALVAFVVVLRWWNSAPAPEIVQAPSQSVGPTVPGPVPTTPTDGTGDTSARPGSEPMIPPETPAADGTVKPSSPSVPASAEPPAPGKNEPTEPETPNEKPSEKPNEKPNETREPDSPEKPSAEKPSEPGVPLPAPPGFQPGTGSRGKTASVAPVAGRFANLLNDGSPATNDSPPAENPGPAPAAPTETPSSEPEILRPRMREIDVPARLADPLARVLFEDVPLADYVQFLSDLSTLPITLDVDALSLRRLSPATPIRVSLTDTTVRGALTAALEPLQLGFVATNGQVVVTHPPANADVRRSRSHDVSDLVGNDPARAAPLVEWILELVAPESWSEAGGKGTLRVEKGTLVVEQTEPIQLQLQLLCDKLRVARGLEPRGKFDASLLQVDTVDHGADAALATPIKLNFSRPTRINQILDRFGKVAGLRIVVDWQALGEAGWPPETAATLNVEGKPLREALQQLLGPRELTFRVVDAQTLQVTTPTAVERRLEWEFHSLTKLPEPAAEPEQVLSRLQDVVGATSFRAAGGAGSLRYDVPSKSILAALPQPQQRLVAEGLRAGK